MAESVAHDVVKEAQSAGERSSSDDTAKLSNDAPAGDGLAQAKSSLPILNNSHVPEGADEAEMNAGGGFVEDSESQSQKLESISNDVAASALADASGGSDTDTSRADGGEGGKDAKGHMRTGSVKKPASFKAVSVTKNFLAKNLSASPGVRPADKVAPSSPSPVSALQSAKPRLVAKSALGGVGARGLTKMNGAGGPDASKVWNKNQPVAPPPPRQFTDEELQTRYGIHMATRLQSDETGKDAKWADIDDDEDDWAPETVEWMDGTKSNVPAPTDPQPIPTRQEDRAPVPENAAPAEPVRPTLTSMHKPTVSQSTKTILKPGAGLNLLQKSGTAQKPSADKPAQLSKGPALPPTKSPWATLPPVDNIAPINPPVQQPQRPFQRDPSGFDSLPPPPPAKEIAADDFNRNWRDDRGTKELFNAQSGRYEPAMDARRGSRQEHGYRQPAVLQRPMPPSNMNGPAEPSAAFQTSRATAEGGAPWSRRRASSSLSAAGGRRPSFAQLHDVPRPEGMSPMSSVAVESPKLPHANVDRQAQQPGPWQQSAGVPSEASVPEENVPPPQPQEPLEDPVAKQQRMMKEKIERARAQKQQEKEAEAAEEAARKERLRLKMAALGAPTPSPELKEKGKETGPPVKPVGAASPPKPPVPTSEGEVAQYGLMKVHQPHPVKKNVISEQSLTARSTQQDNAAVDPGHGLRGPPSPNKAVSRPTTLQQPPSAPADRAQKRLPDAPMDKVAGPWKSPSPQDYNWGSSTMNARSAVVTGANVWGPPMINEKSLGNGTFESKFSHSNFGDNRKFTADNRFDNRGGGLNAHGPIGSRLKNSTPPRQSHFAQTFQNLNSKTDQSLSEPSSNQVSDSAFASSHLDSSLQQSIARHSSLQPNNLPLTSQSPSTTSNNMSAATISSMAHQAPVGAPRQMGMHSGEISRGHAEAWMKSGTGSDVNSWATFKADDDKRMKEVIAQSKKDDALAEAAEMNALPEPKTVMIVVDSASGNFIETYNITQNPDGTWTKDPTPTSTGNSRTPANLAKLAQSSRDFPQFKTVVKPIVTLGPPGHRKKLAAAQAALEATTATANEATPPPAEEGLFERDTTAAKVKLPNIPIVKLPGASPSKMPVPPRSPAFDKTFGKTFQGVPKGPSAMTKAEQDQKYQNWLSHVKVNQTGMKVDSKPAFDVGAATAKPNGAQSITVAVTPFKADKSSSVVSKPSADEAVFDAPEFASMPAVRLPPGVHKNHHLGYSHDSHMLHATRPQSRLQQRVDAQTVLANDYSLFPAQKGEKRGTKVVIFIPGMKPEDIKTVDVDMKRGSRPSFSNKPNFNNKNFGTPRRGPGPNHNKNGTAAGPSNTNNRNGNGGPSHWNNKNGRPTHGSSPRPQRGNWGPRNPNAAASAAAASGN